MAIGVQPVDGLIHRLLPQNAKPTTAPDRPAAVTAARQYQVNISPKAHIAQSEHGSEDGKIDIQKKPGEKALESHLLNLYRSNDKFGG